MGMINKSIFLCKANELELENIFQVRIPNAIEEGTCKVEDGELKFCYSYPDTAQFTIGNQAHTKVLEIAVFLERYIKYRQIKCAILNSFISENNVYLSFTSGFNHIKR